MKTIYYGLLTFFSVSIAASGQTLEEAKTWYKQKNFALAKPVFERELQAKPTDPSLNLWYGVSLYKTGGNVNEAESHLKVAAQKSLPDASLYLGDIYTTKYLFTQAVAEYDKYAKLKRTDKEALAAANERKAKVEKYLQLVHRTEDVQIIDSLVVDKDKFLKAYKLSPASGRLAPVNELFNTKEKAAATAYLNEKGTKIYYSRMVQDSVMKLYSMEKLLDQFGNEKQVSPSSFGLKGDENYPFVLTDGVTLYFAAKDEDSMGGYDLFATRYNLDKDSYLVPERLNMPFNSIYNDYMLAIDEEKGVGWFASDRFQPEGKVCVYTFIPNSQVKPVESESTDYLSARARILSIKDSWRTGTNYTQLIALARKTPEVKVEKKVDFTFVINDKAVYHSLADFRNSNARELFSQLRDVEKTLAAQKNDLEQKRISYFQADADTKRQMTQDILSLEKETESMDAKQKQLTIQVRNLENKEIGN
ncbi:MAG: hypothetical protein BGN96_14340 [Bacteroidales bacterium 45-6]|nr:MAG: hypothetical protein BGN96_14340 [Bacteroidales bacterium 45-6]